MHTLSPDLRSAIIAEARAVRAHRKESRKVGGKSVQAWRTVLDRAEDTGRIMRRDYPDHVTRGEMWKRVFRITYMRG